MHYNIPVSKPTSSANFLCSSVGPALTALGVSSSFRKAWLALLKTGGLALASTLLTTTSSFSSSKRHFGLSARIRRSRSSQYSRAAPSSERWGSHPRSDRRLKEIIIRGGQNISPTEVEEAILKNETVFSYKHMLFWKVLDKTNFRIEFSVKSYVFQH